MFGFSLYPIPGIYYSFHSFYFSYLVVYVTHSICCPSRASIMTGRLGVRTGIFGHLPPWASAGLPASELTVASLLRGHGYRTIALGKWHLGHQPPHEPLSHGFDEWIGLPFSNE